MDGIFDRLLDIPLYLIFEGVFHLFIYPFIFIWFVIFHILLRKFNFWQILRKSLIFLLCLYFFGLLGHILWSNFIWSMAYYSPDYVVDFFMFRPFQNSQLYVEGWHENGYYIGDNYFVNVFICWLLLSVFLWLLTFISYDRIILRKQKEQYSLAY